MRRALFFRPKTPVAAAPAVAARRSAAAAVHTKAANPYRVAIAHGQPERDDDAHARYATLLHFSQKALTKAQLEVAAREEEVRRYRSYMEHSIWCIW